jgi:uncharacterized membrane protein YhdT
MNTHLIFMIALGAMVYITGFSITAYVLARTANGFTGYDTDGDWLVCIFWPLAVPFAIVVFAVKYPIENAIEIGKKHRGK